MRVRDVRFSPRHFVILFGLYRISSQRVDLVVADLVEPFGQAQDRFGPFMMDG